MPDSTCCLQKKHKGSVKAGADAFRRPSFSSGAPVLVTLAERTRAANRRRGLIAVSTAHPPRRRVAGPGGRRARLSRKGLHLLRLFLKESTAGMLLAFHAGNNCPAQPRRPPVAADLPAGLAGPAGPRSGPPHAIFNGRNKRVCGPEAPSAVRQSSRSELRSQLSN